MKTRMVNGALNDDSTFKPDFQVFSRAINIKCIVVVTEFKPTSRNSAVESDLVKLGKQMKLIYNNLVAKRIPKPSVCGLLCQRETLCTYVMDMPSSHAYRMNITLENVKKAEDYIITANSFMHRQPCNHPELWLSFSSCQLLRSNKKRKPSE
ncbi:hypothetical protein MFLAVUS_009611 [Mucor flavus]|uniref:Uncharacterized protein n=1 Tax=Mucor flavus TaxID=439312 RepID=A0ABP9ZAL2_9FUNG